MTKRVDAVLNALERKRDRLGLELYREVTEIIKELYAENQALKADKWQTMDNAPIDGTHLLLISDSGHLIENKMPIVEGFYRFNKWWCSYSHEKSIQPTHWKRLPAPPEAALQSQEE